MGPQNNTTPAPAAALASVSVDLDPIECYRRIHGLPGGVPEPARFAVLRRCLPRFADLFGRHGLRATFFVVAQDLEQDAEGAARLAELARAGHELASHTWSHPYDLVSLDTGARELEVDRAHAAIGSCAGRGPVGFRAPGYAVSAALLDLLTRRGYRYDSSAFPSVPYYAAKAAVMAGLRLLGRPSGSRLDSPQVMRAPLTPYRPSRADPYRRGSADDRMSLLELPITVTPFLRLPVIGTSLVTFPELLRRRLVAGALRQRFLNLELHGIDLCDAESDGIPSDVVGRQLDLRVPLARKLAALDATLGEIRAAGFAFKTLEQAAADLAAA